VLAGELSGPVGIDFATGQLGDTTGGQKQVRCRGFRSLHKIFAGAPMQPGYGNYQQQPGPPQNNMGMAVLALLLFWPLGIMAIINASKVNGLAQSGDWAGAQNALAESKKWTKYALITAAVWYGVVIVCCIGWVVVGGAGALFSSTS
jgi:hypothetical protein